MRILLVSQMYPSAAAPDLGVFVRDLERELASFGHELERVVIDTRSGGKRRYLRLLWGALAASRPDVVYAHFLVPSGLIAALAGRAPLVVTAHGQDVANVGTIPGVRAATRVVVRRAASVIAVSGYLRELLEERLPEARGKTEVIDCGVDLERFRPLAREAGPAPAFLCVGSLTERKNVLRLARSFERLGEGTLTFVGDGPLRAQLEGRQRDSRHGRRPARSHPGLSRSGGRPLSAVARRAVRPVRRSRRSPALARSSRHGSEARRSSSATGPGSSSTHSTRTP